MCREDIALRGDPGLEGGTQDWGGDPGLEGAWGWELPWTVTASAPSGVFTKDFEVRVTLQREHRGRADELEEVAQDTHSPTSGLSIPALISKSRTMLVGFHVFPRKSRQRRPHARGCEHGRRPWSFRRLPPVPRQAGLQPLAMRTHFPWVLELGELCKPRELCGE